VKQVKQQFGVTINDVVMATIAGAMSQFLRRLAGMRRPPDLRTLVPVNMRREVDGDFGNHVSACLVSLPLGIAAPRRRLLRVAARMRAVKESSQSEAAHAFASTGVPLLGVLMRFADRFNSFNLVVTNVPGPPTPLYLAGAPLEQVFPQVPLFRNQGLGIALFSYAGKLYWGLNGDRDLLPDLPALKRALLDSFDELHALTRRAGPRRKSNVLAWRTKTSRTLGES
jgi:WS/DGAT/MGAT family acyltransferase